MEEEKISKDEVFSKEINQLDKIDENTHTAIKNMGQIWKSCGDKLEKDGICFACKKELKQEDGKPLFNIVQVPHKNIDKGIFALAAICNGCFTNNDT